MDKKDRKKELLLEQLRKTPIIQIACEKLDISRTTYYRWCEENKEFAKAAEQAMVDGQYLVNDLAESQLISAVRERNIQAIMHWLRHHHPAYTDTLQIKHTIQDESLSPEQEALVREALRLAGQGKLEIISIDNKINNNEQQGNDTPSVSGSDDQGPKSEDGHN